VKSRRVGVIVPTGSEFGFVRETLTFSGSELIDGQRYHHFQIPRGGVTGIVRVLSDMGQAPATLAAERIFSRLDVSLVVLIGTAASLDRKVRLGDVVVADQIQEYLRKTGVAPGADDGSVVFERAAESWRTNARLVDHVNNFGWLPDGEPAIAAWQQAATARFPGGSGGHDGPGGQRQKPAVHIGPVATGDLRVAARAFANWIKEANRKLIALEMEAAGAALAAYHNDSADLLVVRGVSDYADELKSELDAGQGAAGVEDAWRRYAVRNAIEYLVLLLSSSGFPWRDKPGTGTAAASKSGSFLTGAALGIGVADALHEPPHDDYEHLHSGPHDPHPDPHDSHPENEHGQENEHEPHGQESADQANATAVELAMLSELLLEVELEDQHGDLGDYGEHGAV
jgi:nucleoside phosphorylase